MRENVLGISGSVDKGDRLIDEETNNDNVIGDILSDMVEVCSVIVDDVSVVVYGDVNNGVVCRVNSDANSDVGRNSDSEVRDVYDVYDGLKRNKGDGMKGEVDGGVNRFAMQDDVISDVNKKVYDMKSEENRNMGDDMEGEVEGEVGGGASRCGIKDDVSDVNKKMYEDDNITTTGMNENGNRNMYKSMMMQDASIDDYVDNINIIDNDIIIDNGNRNMDKSMTMQGVSIDDNVDNIQFIDNADCVHEVSNTKYVFLHRSANNSHSNNSNKNKKDNGNEDNKNIESTLNDLTLDDINRPTRVIVDYGSCTVVNPSSRSCRPVNNNSDTGFKSRLDGLHDVTLNRTEGHWCNANSIDRPTDCVNDINLEKKSSSLLCDDKESGIIKKCSLPVCGTHIKSSNTCGVFNLKCISLNVCGLLSKTKYPELLDLINENDLICLSETKLDRFDAIQFDGFSLFTKNRKKYRSKSGGTAILIRNILLDKLTIIEHVSQRNKIDADQLKYYRFTSHSISDCGVFFELKVDCIENVEKITCASLYIPPEGSVYANRAVFDELEETLLELDAEHILLFGDFNSRTGTIKDFVDDDDDVDNDNLFYGLSITQQMEMFNIGNRFSLDKNVNNFGYCLLDLCKSQNILIVNGRVGEDKGVGKLTCKNTSVVDYVVASPSLFPFITGFYVNEFDECLSDVHCPVHLNIKFICIKKDCSQMDSKEHQTQTALKPTWKNELSESFKENLNEDEIKQVEEELIQILDNTDVISQHDIDNITFSITNIIINAARNTNLIRLKKMQTSSQTVKKTSVRDWFDSDCVNARRRFRASKRAGVRVCNGKRKALRKESYLEYKRLLNKKYHNFRHNFHNSIRNLHSSDPRAYWNLLNKNNFHNKNKNMPSMESFTAHFQKLGNLSQDELLSADPDSDFDINPELLNNDMLNNNISIEEIERCIRKLKNNKAAGYDNILNEYLKAASPKLMRLLFLLFNLILKVGTIPDSWSVGFIRPLYKGKGDPMCTDNYRGITLLSCLGKLFTSILNDRLYAFLEQNNLLGKEQAGFKKGSSTMDHVFALYCLIDLYLQHKKRLFCTFVDFQKAFDSVQHSLLWEKLLSININGRILKVIQNIYSKSKSCVKTNIGVSDFFFCNVGLRQGENLSPVLFSIFLNDLKSFLSKNVAGLNFPLGLANSYNFTDIEEFFNLFLLLYADDTVLLAETPEGMQKCLDSLQKYCNKSGLSININKTKAIVFSRGKVRNMPELFFEGVKLEFVWDYKYLGVLFNFNNKFIKAIKTQCCSAMKAMFALIKKGRKLDLPLDLQLDLFDKCVSPILLFGSEIWAHENLSLCDKLQLRYLKIILNVNKSTSNVMILGEVGQFPISIQAKCRQLCFWYKLIRACTESSSKLSVLLLQFSLTIYNSSNIKLPWLKSIHTMLNSLGLSYIWLNALNKIFLYSQEQFKYLISQRLKDQFVQTWQHDVFDNNICITYRIFKTVFCFEYYLTYLSTYYAKCLLKFRTSCHKLPVQKLRFENVPRTDRLCTLCDLKEIGDEYHYLFCCQNSLIKQKRLKYIPKYYLSHPNMFKLEQLFNCKSKTLLSNLARFVNVIMKSVI